jgi:predicted RNA-binding protein associated with RNAse of E/G family
MNERITVHKLDDRGREVWQYNGALIRKDSSSITLVAYFDRDDVEFHGLHIRRGDRFIETFYSDRWYNIFAIYDANGNRLKGWYCNIARPANIEEGHVYAEDLALDLIVLPDGNMHVLDEDEFAQLELNPEDHANAHSTLSHLQALAAERKFPFCEKTLS